MEPGAVLDEEQLFARVARLARIPRATAGEGERRAAGVIADELRSLGFRVTVEDEEVHGTYWRPIGVTSALAALAAIVPGRAAGAALAAADAAAVVDDLEMGPRLLRRALGRRRCSNVVAEIGPSDPARTVVVHAHHDAAHTGLVFHPRIAKASARLIERTRTTPPLMWGALAAPALVALGRALGRDVLRFAGALLGAAHVAALANIGRSPVVPGANDNLSGVAALLSVAHALAADPPRKTRVILFSSGAEESFLEGFLAFRRRHFASLPHGATAFVVLESVGSPDLLLLDGEGLLTLHRYRSELPRVAADCAAECGIPLAAPLRFRFATGGQIPSRAGYPTVVISSIDWYNAPRNYHWPSDRPEALDYGSVANAAVLAEAIVRHCDRDSSGLFA